VRIDGELMEIWPNEVCDKIPAPSTKILQTKKLVKANHCQHKTDNFYFTSYSPELHFQKNKEVITYKGV